MRANVVKKDWLCALESDTKVVCFESYLGGLGGLGRPAEEIV